MKIETWQDFERFVDTFTDELMETRSRGLDILSDEDDGSIINAGMMLFSLTAEYDPVQLFASNSMFFEKHTFLEGEDGESLAAACDRCIKFQLSELISTYCYKLREQEEFRGTEPVFE